MTNKRMAGWGFLLAAGLFGIAAFVPLWNGGRMNVAFFSLAVVFGILGGRVARRAAR